MEARSYWYDYVRERGGRIATADHLSLPYSTVAGICNGSRGIGRDLAERMAQADPLLDANILIWVRPIKDGEGDVYSDDGPVPTEKAA